jgi:hypothetical protein
METAVLNQEWNLAVFEKRQGAGHSSIHHSYLGGTGRRIMSSRAAPFLRNKIQEKGWELAKDVACSQA